MICDVVQCMCSTYMVDNYQLRHLFVCDTK